MVPIIGWVLVGLFTILTIFEISWDTWQRVKQQIIQNKTSKNKNLLPYWPTWSWARMNIQYILCLLNALVSITMYQLDMFWIFFSICLIFLLCDMHIMTIKTNATYLRLKYGSKRNPVGMALLYISTVLMTVVWLIFNLNTYAKSIKILEFANFYMFWNSILLIYFGCKTYHSMIYYKWSKHCVYTESAMTGTIYGFYESYGFMCGGIVDCCVVSLTLILLLIFGNLYGDKGVFYLYIYPLCVAMLQLSNFTSSFRNRCCIPKCCIESCKNKIVSPEWNKARVRYFRRHPSQGIPPELASEIEA